MNARLAIAPILLTVVIVGCQHGHDATRPHQITITAQPQRHVSDAPKQFRVYGDVHNPGTYTWQPAMSVSDAVKAAGGSTAEDSDIEIKVLRDGRWITFPTHKIHYAPQEHWSDDEMERWENATGQRFPFLSDDTYYIMKPRTE